MIDRRPLRGARGGSKNAFTVGNGHHLGLPPGTWEEPGDRPVARVPGTGGRRAASAMPASWSAWRGEAGQGPSISYMEGPFLILPGRNVFARVGTAATAGMPAAMIRGQGRAQGRSPGGHAATGDGKRGSRRGRQQARAGPSEC